MLFTSDDSDFISDLGSPNPYLNVENDCRKFYELYVDAATSVRAGTSSPVFELSTAFLAVRNFATCFALGFMNVCEFSRLSCKRLGSNSLNIGEEELDVLVRARLLSTRGYGAMLPPTDISKVVAQFSFIELWMKELMKEKCNV